jgi:hypothetical protein
MPQYRLPAELTDPAKLFEQADARRRVLRNAGLTTFVIGRRGGQAAIVCLCCGLGSSNPNDIERRYCGFCKAFHDDVPPAEVES